MPRRRGGQFQIVVQIVVFVFFLVVRWIFMSMSRFAILRTYEQLSFSNNEGHSGQSRFEECNDWPKLGSGNGAYTPC